MILLAVPVAWLAGATLGALGYGEWWPAAVLSGVGLASGWALVGRWSRAMLAVAVLLAGGLSLMRFEAALPPSEPGGIAVYNGAEPVRLVGTVSSEPEERPITQRFVVDVEAVAIEGIWQPSEGRVLVSHRLFPRYRYGDAVMVEAVLETPPRFETFDYREYLARRGIVSMALFPTVELLATGGGQDLKRWLIEAREPFGDALKQALPEPESALARGILLGQRASIPAEVNEAFNAAGISHLIAISGYNVMLVGGAIIGLLSPLIGRREATVIALVVIAVYALFVGGDPPVLRALFMALVMLGATLVGRPGSALTGVALAGAVMVFLRPLAIVDVSFQLSFAATLGLVLFATPMKEGLQRGLSRVLPPGFAGALAEPMAVTTAASLAVLPIIASSFGRLSLVSLPANVLAGPAFVFALLGSFVTALLGTISTDAGRIAGELTYLPLHYLVKLAEVSSSLPVATVTLERFALADAVVLYIAAGLVALILARIPRDLDERLPAFQVTPAPALAVASAVAAGFLWWGALQPDSDRLRVVILDVGQGDAILVETPSGSRVLVDGGPSGALVSQALGEVMSPGERRIDLMVLTHAQDDHVTGLVEVLRRYEVDAVLWNGEPGASNASRTWLDEVHTQGIPLAVARAGLTYDLGDGVLMEVLHPQAGPLQGTEDDLNNNAVVLRLEHGDVSFLLTGDIEVDGENALLDAGHHVGATVLKVAHHGSDGATTPAFLDAVSPQFAVVSAGAGNTFGHPSPSLRLRLAGIPLLRTDLNGHVTFETDGKQLWLSYERGEVELLDAAVRQ